MKTVILFFVLFLGLTGIGYSQNAQDVESMKSNRKAECLKEDISKFLANNTKYPMESLQRNIQGDVVLSFVISKDGKLNDLKTISSPDKSLLTSSVVALNGVPNDWRPCENEGKPVDKEYLLVFRYRMYRDTQPFDYKDKVGKLVQKQKYDKALKLINDAIKDNPYSSEYYQTRSDIKNRMGDTNGSKEDAEQSDKLRNEILACIDIAAISVVRVVTVNSSVTQTQHY